MDRPWRRWTPPFALGAALLLSGCTVDGTIEFTAHDTAVVDVVVTHDPVVSQTLPDGSVEMVGGGLCDTGSSWGLEVEQRGTPDRPECRLHGTVDLTDPTRAVPPGLVVHGDGHLFVRVPVNSSSPGRVNLSLVFPGPVVHAPGLRVDGNRLRVADDDPPADSPLTTVVARDAAAPDLRAWAPPLALGFVGTGLGAAAGWAWRRFRSTRSDAAGADPTDATPAPPAPDAAPPEPPQDPAVWAPDAGATP